MVKPNEKTNIENFVFFSKKHNENILNWMQQHDATRCRRRHPNDSNRRLAPPLSLPPSTDRVHKPLATHH